MLKRGFSSIQAARKYITEDIKTATALTEVNREAFANDNNIWRSQHMKLEEMGIADAFDQ